MRDKRAVKFIGPCRGNQSGSEPKLERVNDGDIHEAEGNIVVLYLVLFLFIFPHAKITESITETTGSHSFCKGGKEYGT